MNNLSLQDVDASIREKVAKQQYNKPTIDGVKVVTLDTYLAEDGSFTELLRFDDQSLSELFSGFKVAQINRSVMMPNTVKAWHLHFGQDEVWNVGANTRLFLGLWDVRESSSTKGASMRIPLAQNKIVFIPRGVAHGAANHSGKPAEILYFMSSRYDKDAPDEQRLPWDALGREFWDIKRE